MRISIFYIFLLYLLVNVVVSCSQKNNTTESNNKEAQLEQLKKERTELNKKIESLEAEIGVANVNEPNLKEHLVILNTVEPRYFEHSINLQSLVESEENILVTSQASGIVNSIKVVEGQKVYKGQVLAQLDNSILEASIEEVKTSLDLAETRFQRQSILWKQKIGTEIQYITVRHERDALLKKLETLKRQLNQMQITAPVSGTIDNVIIKIGSMATPSSPTFRIVNDSKLKVRANVPERYVSMINKGDKVVVSFPDINLSTNSKVNFVSRSIDLKSRTFFVDASLKPHKLIKSNMVAVMKIIDYTNKEALVIPLNIIQNLNGRNYVLIVNENENKQKVADLKYVEIGKINGNLAEITSGLQAGDKVIVQGFEGLTKGDYVKTSEI